MGTMIAGIAAAQLGISTRSLNRWTSQGKIPAERTVGGWNLYDPRDVQRLKAELTKRTQGR